MKLNISIKFDWLCLGLGFVFMAVALYKDSIIFATLAGIFTGMSFGYGLREETPRISKLLSSFSYKNIRR